MVHTRTKLGMALGALLFTAGTASVAAAASPSAAPAAATTFTMQPSQTAATAGCLTGAGANVSITRAGQVENMTISAFGLPANTGFDVFVTQVPNGPFGIAWYQGDLNTNSKGTGSVSFKGRFSIETFAVAPGTAPAPVVHGSQSTNPAFGPIAMFHLGAWFDSPTSAAAAGCPNTITPFNGEHHAGVQALSTKQFSDANGPLRQVG